MTKTEIIKLIQFKIEENKSDLRDYEAIKKALTPLQGKSFATKPIDKVLNPIGFKWDLHAGMYHAKPIKEEKRYKTHLIGYASSGAVIDVEKLENFDSWACNGAKGRIYNLERLLNDAELFNKMYTTFNKLNKAWKTFVSIAKSIDSQELDSYHNELYYDLIHSYGIGSSLLQDIKYNKEIK